MIGPHPESDAGLQEGLIIPEDADTTHPSHEE
jgi:hypothetical protein